LTLPSTYPHVNSSSHEQQQKGREFFIGFPFYKRFLSTLDCSQLQSYTLIHDISHNTAPTLKVELQHQPAEAVKRM
jgi:hypothetical protein